MMDLRYAILFVTDMDRSIRFYRDVVGLPIKLESPDWVEFSAGATTLALHIAHVDNKEQGHHAPLEAGYCRLGFHVDDLEAVHQRLVEHDVRVINPPEQRFGVQMALYEDPDGAHFTIAEDAKTPAKSER